MGHRDLIRLTEDLTPVADAIASNLYRRRVTRNAPKGAIREACLPSMGSLDALAMSILVDLIASRLGSPRSYGLTK